MRRLNLADVLSFDSFPPKDRSNLKDFTETSAGRAEDRTNGDFLIETRCCFSQILRRTCAMCTHQYTQLEECSQEVSIPGIPFVYFSGIKEEPTGRVMFYYCSETSVSVPKT